MLVLYEDKKIPLTGVAAILTTNFLERFAYYGFRAIVVLFLVDQADGGMGLTNEQALETYANFTMYTYLALFVGGLFGDLIFGSYRSLILGVLLMILGYGLLSIAEPKTMYIAIGLIALGTGVFKPNILTILTQQMNHFPEKLDSIFTTQYLLVN